MEKILCFDDFVELNEANRNYSLIDFKYDMRKLGWTFENDHANGQQFAKYVERQDGTKERLKVVAHIHDKRIDAGTLNELPAIFKKEYELTGDRSFIDSAPWEKWGLKKPDIDTVEQQQDEDVEVVSDKEMSSISWANTRYNKVELEPLSNYIYNADEGVCIMKKTELRKVKYNTCRSENDRRPLNKLWFDEQYKGNHEKSPTGFAFAIWHEKKRNDDGCVMDVYPVMKNGVVGKMFRESNDVNF